jgi:hypothetical protein
MPETNVRNRRSCTVPVTGGRHGRAWIEAPRAAAARQRNFKLNASHGAAEGRKLRLELELLMGNRVDSAAIMMNFQVRFQCSSSAVMHYSDGAKSLPEGRTVTMAHDCCSLFLLALLAESALLTGISGRRRASISRSPLILTFSTSPACGLFLDSDSAYDTSTMILPLAASSREAALQAL